MLSHHLVPTKTVAKKIKQFVTHSHPKVEINLEENWGAVAHRGRKKVSKLEEEKNKV